MAPAIKLEYKGPKFRNVEVLIQWWLIYQSWITAMYIYSHCLKSLGNFLLPRWYMRVCVWGGWEGRKLTIYTTLHVRDNVWPVNFTSVDIAEEKMQKTPSALYIRENLKSVMFDGQSGQPSCPWPPEMHGCPGGEMAAFMSSINTAVKFLACHGCLPSYPPPPPPHSSLSLSLLSIGSWIGGRLEAGLSYR